MEVLIILLMVITGSFFAYNGEIAPLSGGVLAVYLSFVFIFFLEGLAKLFKKKKPNDPVINWPTFWFFFRMQIFAFVFDQALINLQVKLHGWVGAFWAVALLIFSLIMQRKLYDAFFGRAEE